jgi:hypothetical protein
MRLPGKVAPSRHMVEPQSPLQLVRNISTAYAEYTPEVGDDLVSAICDLLVLLRGTLRDLEAVIGENGIAGVGASANLAAVDAMTKDLMDCQSVLYPWKHYLRWPRCCPAPRSGHCRTCIHQKASCWVGLVCWVKCLLYKGGSNDSSLSEGRQNPN